MKKYVVRINARAKQDLRASFFWGVEKWGEENARSWLAEIQDEIFERLSFMPKGFPLAPESREFENNIRQFVFGRYRVLFTVKTTSVAVLRVRGPYTGSVRD